MTHADAVRDAIANAVADLIDAAATPGKILLQTSGNQTVATLTFGKPSFAAPASGVMQANAITADPSAIGGTVYQATIQDGDGNAVLLCTVSALGNGGDIELDDIQINPGQQVALASLSYTAPP
jgi:hypothetical protein